MISLGFTADLASGPVCRGFISNHFNRMLSGWKFEKCIFVISEMTGGGVARGTLLEELQHDTALLSFRL